jgi:hypothetical protein
VAGRSTESLGIMGRIVGLLALAAMSSVLAVACAEAPARTACDSDHLSDERVREISIAEFRKRGGIYRDDFWNWRVTRENCRVYFFSAHKEASPGFNFGVQLDETGKVVRYDPGL